jgi:large subunit ribosomal protein L18
MKFKRRREGRTDYRMRLALLKSRKPRLVVRAQSRSVTAQLIEFDEKGDRVVMTATSIALRKMGYGGHTGNAKAAYLTGFLAGKKALKAGMKEAVLDIGLHTPVRGSNVFAALKGAVDAGLSVPHAEEAFPKQERVNGSEVTAVKQAIEKSVK